MSFLVDTNVLSEPTRRHPDPNVLAWLAAHAGDYYVSSVTIGELVFGIERLAPGRQRRALESWLQRSLSRLQGRVLAFNTRTAAEWGRLMAELEPGGVQLSVAYGQIAATARRHGLTMATDNVADFRPSGVRIVNPFD